MNSAIIATTGRNASNVAFGGAGGNLNLNSSAGPISVSSTLQVSSNDATSSSPIRRSASAGNISLHSGLTTGSAITLAAGSQLLSLLNAGAPGPGGAISVISDGGDIIADGRIEADRGTITISNGGGGGAFTPDGAPPAAPLVRLDGGSITSEMANIFSTGDLMIGTSSSVAFNVVTLSLIASRNLTWSGAIMAAGATASNASVTIAATRGALHITGDLEIDRSSGDTTNGMNVSISAQTALTIDGNLRIRLTPALVDSGANTTLFSAGDINIGSALSLYTEVRSDLTNGANIFVTAGADTTAALNAGTIDATLKVDPGVSLGTFGAGITFSISGDIRTNGAANFTVDDSLGGHFANSALLNVSAASISTNGNAFNATINNSGGTISGDANLELSTQGNFTAGDTALQILNSDDGGAATPGTISGGVSIFVNTNGNFSANSLLAFINSRHGGLIGPEAVIQFAINGALNVTNDATFGISMRNDGSGGGTVAGSVNDSVVANSISVGGLLTGFISTNGGGKINGDARMSFQVPGGDLSADGGVMFNIGDTGFGPTGNFLAGGEITGTAQVLTSANNITTTSTSSGVPGTDLMALEFSIYPNGRGNVGGDALVNVNASQNITAPGSVFFAIANGNFRQAGGGTIGGNATINARAANLSSGDLFFDIYNYGGGKIGGNASINLTLNHNLTASGDAQLLIDDNAGTIGGSAAISLVATNVAANSLLAQINNANGGVIGTSATITFNLTGQLTTTNDLNLIVGEPPSGLAAQRQKLLSGGREIHANGGGTAIDASVGSLNVGGSVLAFVPSDSAGSTISLTSSGDMNVTGDLTLSFNAAQSTLSSGGSIVVGGSIAAYNQVSANQSISARDIFSSSVSSGLGVTINGGYLLVDRLTSGGAVTFNNAFAFSNETATSDGSINFTPVPFTFSASAIVSSGSNIPALVLNGDDADPTFAHNNPGDGGTGAMTLSAPVGLTIGSANDLNGIVANGGSFAANSASTAGGNGGTININSNGDVTLNDANIIATSGLIPDAVTTAQGNGGAVNITSNGAINVNSKIEVSSNDPIPSPSASPTPHRRSKQGGNIALTARKAGTANNRAVAINVTNSGQLLSLLNASAPGPGGSVVIRASGGNSDLNVKGRVQADRGTVDIRHTGANGNVNLDGTVPNTTSATLDVRADTVKVAALGSNGILKIGGGNISADTTMQLYATGFSGQVQFIANVSLNGNSVKSIAGNSVTILNGVNVTVGGPAADVYVGQVAGAPVNQNANYSARNGGNGSTTGLFTGSGANAPKPLSSAPPLDPAAAIAGSHH
ncbi:MAG TPA: hypothetical protein VGC85_02255 [Chthoniobacterales bacterium]